MEQLLDLFLKEAEASDAECLLDFFKDVATESDFMTLAPEGLGMTNQESWKYLLKHKHKQTINYVSYYTWVRIW